MISLAPGKSYTIYHVISMTNHQSVTLKPRKYQLMQFLTHLVSLSKHVNNLIQAA